MAKNPLPMRRKIKITLVTILSLFALFLLIIIGIPYLNFTFTSSDDNPNKSKVKIIAHRGASGLAPENTLAAFKKAMDLGADMIELDVHVSKDDSLIVMHDYNVKRTTSGEGDIENLTYNYIKSLDAGSWFKPEFKDERVPTLNEVLQLANGKTKVLIELKWPANGLYQTLVNDVVACVKKNHAEDWVIIQTFEPAYLQELAKVAPNLVCHQLIFGRSGILPVHVTRKLTAGYYQWQPNASSINMHYFWLTKGYIAKAHAADKTVYAYTINDEKKMRQAINLGVDGIITNFPNVANKVLGR